MNTNTRMIVKLAMTGILIVAAGVLLRGHDVLRGVALVALALLVIAKIVAAIIYRRRGGSGPYDGGRPLYTPIAIPPNRPKPPELTGALKD